MLSQRQRNLLSWLRQRAVPLKTVEAGSGFDDLQPLKSVIGNARIVALGEATHGTREFFQLKHRLLEFLVTEMDFTTFAMEANWPECLAANDYVLHGRGDPARILAGLHCWPWDTEEVLDLMRWMRQYNIASTHRTKVTFGGFDAQFTALAATTIQSYLAQVDPEFAAQIAPRMVAFELRGQRSDVFRVRQSSLEPYLPWLDEQWEAGCRNGAALWRALRLRGFRGCLRVVSEWSARRKKADKADPAALARAPSARTVARLLTVGRERLSKAETITVACDRERRRRPGGSARNHPGVPGHHSPELADLDAWISRASVSLVAAFANGVSKDKAAIEAAIASPWSNGQTEGQICKLKLVKRQMYGRGNLDLLQARVIGLG